MARVPDSPWRPGEVGEHAIWQNTTKFNHLGEIRESRAGGGGRDRWAGGILCALLTWPWWQLRAGLCVPAVPSPGQLLTAPEPPGGYSELLLQQAARSCAVRTSLTSPTPPTFPTSAKSSYSSDCVCVGPRWLRIHPQLCISGRQSIHN